MCICLLSIFSPKPLTSIEESHVYRMLQEDHELPHEPRQSGSFKALQDYVESDGELPLHHLSLEGCNVEFIRQKLQLVEPMKKSKLFSI